MKLLWPLELCYGDAEVLMAEDEVISVSIGVVVTHRVLLSRLTKVAYRRIMFIVPRKACETNG